MASNSSMRELIQNRYRTYTCGVYTLPGTPHYQCTYIYLVYTEKQAPTLPVHPQSHSQHKKVMKRPPERPRNPEKKQQPESCPCQIRARFCPISPEFGPPGALAPLFHRMETWPFSWLETPRRPPPSVALVPGPPCRSRAPRPPAGTAPGAVRRFRRRFPASCCSERWTSSVVEGGGEEGGRREHLR